MGGSYSAPKKIASKWHPEYFKTLPKMDGKVVLVTGCTSGTGFVCARDCAKLGATVLMLNRDSERAVAATKAVQESAPGSKVVHIPCDLASFSSVRGAVEKVQAECGETGVDVLCNNAGVMASKDEATVDGYDIQMQTNHLSHFLLTSSLWPLLKKAADARGEARVVNHSSLARKGKKLDAKYLGKNGGNLGGDSTGMLASGPPWVRYQQTKLANLVFTYALRDRITQAGSNVKVLVAHPGVASTQLQVRTVQAGTIGGGVAGAVVSQSAEDGALGILRCCCDPEVKNGEFYGPGGYLALKGRAKLLPSAAEEKLADPSSRDMLWKESEQATGVTFSVA